MSDEDWMERAKDHEEDLKWREAEQSAEAEIAAARRKKPKLAGGPYFHVPMNTPPRDCRSCGTLVFWVHTKNGKPMPVDCHPHRDRPHARMPEFKVEDGLGVSHFATCRYAAQHRRKP